VAERQESLKVEISERFFFLPLSSAGMARTYTRSQRTRLVGRGRERPSIDLLAALYLGVRREVELRVLQGFFQVGGGCRRPVSPALAFLYGPRGPSRPLRLGSSVFGPC